MTSKELKIEIPVGFEIDQQKSTFEKIVFKEIQKELTEHINTFADICKEAGITEDEFEVRYKSVLDPQMYAAQQLKLIAQVLNKDQKADWNNSNEYKYIIWWDMRGKGSLFYVDAYRNRSSVAPSCLTFREIDMAEFAVNKFENIYRTYFMG